MKTFLLLICFMLHLVWIPSLGAEDNTCWIVAGPQEDVWVIVYNENAEGTRGGIIWQGKIPAGEKIKVSSTDGHIRYQYKINPDEGYEGDTSTEDCVQQAIISVD